MGGPLPGRPCPRSPRTFVGPGAPTPWRPPEVGGALGHLLAPSTGPDVCSRPPGPWFPPRASGRRGRCPLPLRSSRKSPPGPLATPTPSTARLAWPGRAGDSRGRRPGGAVRAGGAAAGRPCRPSAARQARVGWFWEGGAPAGGARAVVGFEHSPSGLGPGRAGRESGRETGPPAVVERGASGWRESNLSGGCAGQFGGRGSPSPLCPTPPPPGARKQRLSVCSGAVRTMAPEFYPCAGRGPSSLNCPPPSLVPAPPLGREGSALAAGRGSACPQIPEVTPFGKGQVAAGSPGRGGCVCLPTLGILS